MVRVRTDAEYADLSQAHAFAMDRARALFAEAVELWNDPEESHGIDEAFWAKAVAFAAAVGVANSLTRWMQEAPVPGYAALAAATEREIAEGRP